MCACMALVEARRVCAVLLMRAQAQWGRFIFVRGCSQSRSGGVEVNSDGRQLLQGSAAFGFQSVSERIEPDISRATARGDAGLDRAVLIFALTLERHPALVVLLEFGSRTDNSVHAFLEGGTWGRFRQFTAGQGM